MAPPKKLSPEEEQAVCEALLAGALAYQLAARFACTPSTIRGIAHLHGLRFVFGRQGRCSTTRYGYWTRADGAPLAARQE